jgi:hypothetical protein
MSRVSTAAPPTAGGPADKKPAVVARIPLGLLLSLAAAMLGCHVYSAGLATDGTAGDATRMDGSDSGAGGERPAIDTLGATTIDPNAYQAEVGGTVDLTPIDDPLKVGCSDGRREGFRDVRNWPRIAGCAGGWQWRGLLDASSREPLCQHMAGNGSRNPEGRTPDGTACSAADLCAPTWHACLNGPDVVSHSPTGGCESIVSPGEEALFVVMAGASPQGVCYPDSLAENDIHGCGSIGQKESGGCPPLDRRMGFSDCAATTGVWECGTATDSLSEAKLVIKPGSSLGGVLCCKD